ASGRSVAHNKIVGARIGNEREAAEQSVRGGDVQVHALHQQRPVARREAAQVAAAKRTVSERPAAALAHDEPRLDVVAKRKRPELGPGEQVAESWNRLANEQRTLLPIAGKEARRGGAAEKRAWHRSIIAAWLR